MIRKMEFAIALTALALTAGVIHAQAPSSTNIDRAQLKQMIRSAHNAPQYQALASYFRSKQQAFEQQAQSEKLEWERRSQNVVGSAAKYPRPVDSSRNRYQYFTYEAQQMSDQAAHYESLSATATQ